jgi:tetratricopeptide (TPR) repeat protein
MIKKIILILFIINTVFITFAAAQKRLSDIDYARRLEHAQEFERALTIYSRLYDKGNTNHEVTSGIVNCYYGLQQYQNLIDFLSELIKKNPRRYDYKIDLGRAYYMNNQKGKALQTWDEVIKSSPPDVMKFRFTASAMAQLHLFDEAIEVYKKTIRTFKGQEMIYRDIALLYRNQLNYGKATEYLLKYYDHYKKRYNDFYIQIMYIIADKDALAPAINEFEKYLADHSDKRVSELLGGLFLRNDNIDKAYAVYEKLYRQDKNINHLLNFSREAELKDEFHYAIKAYNEILSAKPSEQTALNIKLNMAKDYYSLAKKDDNNEYITRSMQLLQELTVNNKYRTFKVNATELLGDIYLHYYNDLDKAIQEYNKVLNIEKNKRIKERILLKLANAYFLKNDIDRSKNIYDKITGRQNLAYALYQKGNLSYYRGNFSMALRIYNQALNKAGIRDSISNNILEQIMMINRFAKDSTSLAKFSNALRLEKQGRKSQAAEKYYSLFLEGKEIGSLAGLKSARILKQIGKTEEAVKTLKEFTKSYPDADNSDEAWFLLGQYESGMKKYDKALEAYQKIMDDFPSSFYLDHARENARAITKEHSCAN